MKTYKNLNFFAVYPRWPTIKFYHGRGGVSTMTNEELASKIQDGGGGEEDLLLLWDQVRRFAAAQARRWARASTGVEVEDLLQVGFLAMLDALERWNRVEGSFIAWYSLRLKGAFTEAVGLRTARQRNDPLRGAVSLDAPVGHDEADPITILDVLEDPTAERAMQGVMERDFAAERSRTLHRLLDQLDETQRQAAWYVHALGFTVPQAAARLQLDAATVRSAADSALRFLRRPANARQLLGLWT